jgi:Late embryogenesis abundant protein
MKKTYIIGGLALAGAAWAVWVASKVQALQGLTTRLGVPRSIGISGGNLAWVQDVIFSNPNGVGVKINSIDLVCYLGTQAVGTAKYLSPTTLVANAETPISILVTVPIFSFVFSGIAALLAELKKGKATFRLSGKATAEGITANINQSFDLVVPSYLKSFI